MPIAVSLGIVCIASVLLFTQMPLSMMVQSMFTAMNSFVMVAVPLFILTGTLMDESGVADRIYRAFGGDAGVESPHDPPIDQGAAMLRFDVDRLRLAVRVGGAAMRRTAPEAHAGDDGYGSHPHP